MNNREISKIDYKDHELTQREQQILKEMEERSDMLLRLQGKHVPTEEERRQNDRALKARMAKLDTMYEILDTIRDILCTPLTPIFGILALVTKIIMYGSAFTFLYSCYKVYKSISDGSSLLVSFSSEWKYFVLPFIAAFLYFIFDSISDYCSWHRLY